MIHSANSLLAFALTVAFTLTSCMDADPFGLSAKRIVGKYRLEKFENGNYYLLKDGYKGSGGGYIDGTVLEIGWDSNTLVARRLSNYRGDTDGWMIIDLESDRMVGPVSENDFRASHPSLRTYDPDTAWRKL